MKPIIRAGVLPAVVAAGLLQTASAGSFTADFNDALLPGGSTLYGNGTSAGVIKANGGVGDSGCVRLTEAANSLQGSYIISDLDGGGAVRSFTAAFKMRLGGGSSVPADGCSFCVAADLPTGTFGEGGAGSGLRIGFDIYDNVDGDPNNAGGEAPAFTLYWNNVLLQRVRVPLSTIVSNTFIDVIATINPNGTLDFSWNGVLVWDDYYLGYLPIAGAQFGWGGRTGGLNTNQFVDDISITTVTGALVPLVVQQPASIRMVPGYGAPFTVAVNDPGMSFQWEKKGPSDPGFTAIPGAISASYVTALTTLADAGTEFRVVCSNAAGSATSNVAVLDVVTLPHGVPTASFPLNDTTTDGMIVTPVTPAGTNAYGSAAPQLNGGVGDSGHMRLTENANSQAGTWTVNDLNSGNPVESIDVAFKLKMSDGTTVPADGFGFHWAPDLPAAGFPTAEEPVGNGLSVCFDVYDSTDGNPFTPGGEGPAIDVFWLRNRVGGTIVPIQFLNTGGTFQDVCIRLSAAGKIDVMFNGIVLVYQLQVPNWTAFSGASYGFAARTGGLNQTHAVDDVTIRSVPYAGPIGVVSHPAAVTTVVGRTATFSVTSNDPTATTYQWQVQPVGGSYADIPGAQSQTYTTPPFVAGDNGSLYRCVVTSTRNATTANSNGALATILNIARPAAPQVNYTFDDGTTVTNVGTAGVAATATLSGNAIILADGGTANTGSIRLTEYSNDQFGTLVVDNFNAAAAVGSFTMAVNAQIFGDNPADGWSFSWGNIAQSQAYGELERGIGPDLRVGFITYAPNTPGVEVYWRGTLLTKAPAPIALLQTPGSGVSEEVLVHFETNISGVGAKITVVHDGVPLVNGLDIPGFTGLANARFALGARTGGSFEEHRFDDLCIQTSPYVGPINITSEPSGITVVNGKSGTISVGVNDPGRTSFQWEAGNAQAGPFAPVSGAVAATLTGVPPASTTTWFRCVCTAPSNTVTSIAVPVTSVDLALPATWEREINFNDGLLPADMLKFGTAQEMTAGGVGGSGMVQLTVNANDQQGSIVLPDQDPGQRVLGFSSRFFMRIGDVSTPPADGASFIWSPEEITGPFGESGSGSGLIVTFDIYNNSGEAPAIRGSWRGNPVFDVRVPLDLLVTDAQFVEVVIRVNTDGTLDVVWDCFVAAWKAPLPSFGPISGYSFGWGARTGGLNAAQEVDEIQLLTIAEPKPLVDVSASGGNLTITFDGILQTTTVPGALSGWVDVPGATSPFVVPIGTDAKRYWRARR